MRYIPRIPEAKVRTFLSADGPGRNVLLVEGARQVGKTTLIEQCLRGIHLPVCTLNLDRQKRIRMRIDECVEFDDLTLVLKNECGFNPERPGVLFFDESQESEKLGGFVRFFKEEWPQTWTILTGSTLRRLFRNDQRIPVGRVARLLVTPLSFIEFLHGTNATHLHEFAARPENLTSMQHNLLCEAYDQFLTVGGLPPVVNAYAEGRDWRTVRKDILADYDDDLKRIFGEELIATVRACLRAISARAGTSFKNTSVIPNPTSTQNGQINYVLSRLEQWKLALKSSQQGLDPLQSYGYHPKYYLFDTGMLRDMRETSVPRLKLLGNPDPVVRAALGAILENQTAIDLSRDGRGLAGWKKSSAGAEIDFIVKHGDNAFPVECKSTMKIKGSHLSGMKDYLRIYGGTAGFVVSASPYAEIHFGGNRCIYAIPLYAVHAVSRLAKNG